MVLGPFEAIEVMQEFPHLSRAPITEALLDIRVEAPDPAAPVDSISAAFRAELGTEYPDDKPIDHMQAQVAFAVGGESATAAKQQIGRIFWSSDHKRAVQARTDGFTINHVGDYKDWDAILGDARRYWPTYLAVATPRRVIRCAARFINRIEIPAGEDLGIHFKTRPEISDDLSRNMENYFMRVTIPLEDEGAHGGAGCALDGGRAIGSRAMLTG